MYLPEGYFAVPHIKTNNPKPNENPTVPTPCWRQGAAGMEQQGRPLYYSQEEGPAPRGLSGCAPRKPRSIWCAPPHGEKVTPGYQWARADVYILWKMWKCFLPTSLTQTSDFHNRPAIITRWFLGNLDSRLVIWNRMGQTFKCSHKLSFVLNRSCWMLNRSWKNLADSTCLIQNHLQWCIYWFYQLSFYLLKIHLEQGKKILLLNKCQKT